MASEVRSACLIFGNDTILKHTALQDGMVKCQRFRLIKVSILDATYRSPVRTVEGVHVGIVAVEAEVARIRTAYRTTPIVAASTDTAERTIGGVVAVAGHGQFKRRREGSDFVVRCPCAPFLLPLGIRRYPET